MDRLEITVEFNNTYTDGIIVSHILRNLMKATLTSSTYVRTIKNKPRDVYKCEFNIVKKKIDLRKVSLELNTMLPNSKCVVRRCR